MITDFENNGLQMLQRRLSSDVARDQTIFKKSEQGNPYPITNKSSKMFKKFNQQSASPNEVSLPLTKGVYRQPSLHKSIGKTTLDFLSDLLN